MTPIDSDYIERAIGPNGWLSQLQQQVANLEHGEMAKIVKTQDSDRRAMIAAFRKLEMRVQALEAERGKATTPSVFTAVRRENVRLLLIIGNQLNTVLNRMLPGSLLPAYNAEFAAARGAIGSGVLYELWCAWASIKLLQESLSEGWDA